MPYSEHDKLREQFRIDPLFLLGGIVLTWIAGYINSTSLMYFHVPVSHMSGVVSKIGIDLASGQIGELVSLLYIFAGFLGGAVFSGYVLGAVNFRPRKEYSLILMLEGALLVLAMALFGHRSNLGLLFVSMACGMQNAMASTYLGLIVRTTHVTGIVTDLGVLLGQAVRHRTVKRWKIFFLACLLAGFFTGGFMGMLGFARLSYYGLVLPAATCAVSAAAFYRLRAQSA